jgi:hypothetical protein
LELFYNDRSRKAGKSGRCKVCVNRTNKRYYLKNHEDTLDYMKTWRENNATEFKRGYQDARMRKRYGITLEDYERMMVEQGGGCAICGLTENQWKNAPTKLCVDHDHDSGLVRGLLCRRCNVGLGALGDSEEGLERALAYLRRGR